jgi:hypothetical protein
MKTEVIENDKTKMKGGRKDKIAPVLCLDME